MKKDYPLLCNYCNTKQPIGKRKIYNIEISEILVDTSDSKYPHTSGDSRHLQICEECLKYNSINEILIKENREFKSK